MRRWAVSLGFLLLPTVSLTTVVGRQQAAQMLDLTNGKRN